MPNPAETTRTIRGMIESAYRIWASQTVDMREPNPEINSEAEKITRELRKIPLGGIGGIGNLSTSKVRVYELDAGKEYIALVTERHPLARTVSEEYTNHLHTTDNALELIGLTPGSASQDSVPPGILRRMIASGRVTNAWNLYGGTADFHTFTDGSPETEGFYAASYDNRGSLRFHAINAAGKRILGIK